MATLRQTVSKIKNLKIQGSQRIAEAGLLAWRSAKDKKKATKLLMNARPTEPMLFKALKIANSGVSAEKILKKLGKDKKEIYKIGANLIKNNMKIFTHCHSSTVIGILKAAKRQGKKIEVYNTETRPLFQGRITAKELARLKIPITHFVDSAAMLAMKKADIFLIGADWISNKGIVNKIGTGLFADIANVPIYCCSHSWKFSNKDIEIEERHRNEVWKTSKKIKIRNPAFELAERKFIRGIISELGILNYNDFVRRAKDGYI